MNKKIKSKQEWNGVKIVTPENFFMEILKRKMKKVCNHLQVVSFFFLANETNI